MAEKVRKQDERGAKDRIDSELPAGTPTRGSVKPRIVGKGSNPNIMPGVGGATNSDVGEREDIGAGSTDLPEGSAEFRTDQVTSPPPAQTQKKASNG
jgi:hypothetical protein